MNAAVRCPSLRRPSSVAGRAAPIRPRRSSGQRSDGRRTADAGFTLLEMIVATALMGIAVVGLMALISQSTSGAVRVAQYDRAAMLARSQMNDLLTREPLPMGRLQGDYDRDSGWEAQIAPYETPQTEVFGQSVFARIQLTVWWKADGQRKSFELEGFRRTRRTPDMDLAGGRSR